MTLENNYTAAEKRRLYGISGGVALSVYKVYSALRKVIILNKSSYNAQLYPSLRHRIT
jgi:hypothetical protein